MPNDMTAEALGQVVITMLQDAAFVFAEPAESNEREEENVLMARLDFNGPSSGEMVLSCSRTLAADLAANLLGIEPDDPDAIQRGSDALGEMLNIVGGAVLANWFGVDADFEMGVPDVTILDAGAYRAETANAKMLLPLETDEGDRIDVAILS